MKFKGRSFMAKKLKKLRFEIDTEGNNHQVTDESNTPVPPATSSNLMGITKIETLTIIHTKNSPGCVTFYFRGIPHQV
jgi:hypothetical protein